MSFKNVLILTAVLAFVLLLLPLEKEVPFANIVDVAKDVRIGLAEALIIAVFLALTVDQYVKRRLTEEVARNVSSFMMVSELPPTLRQEFHELTQIHLYRRIDVFYKIERRPTVHDVGQIILTGESNSTIFNVRGDNEPYVHYVAVQKPLKKPDGFKSINNVSAHGVLNAEGRIADYEEDAEKAELGRDNVMATHLEWSREVYIPKRGQADFFSKTTQILPEEHEETFVGVMPATHTTLRVDYPSDLVVTVNFGHRLRDQVAATPKGRPSQWTLAHAMLPYQPIIIEWRKVKPIATLPPPAPAVRGEEAEKKTS